MLAAPGLPLTAIAAAAAGTALALLVGCAVEGSSGEPALESVKTEGSALAARLEEIAAQAADLSPGTELGIAVWNLETGEWAATGGDVTHVSASSAKAVWVAAALDGAGVGPVAAHADAVFRLSDNGASGAVIDLVGPDAVNRFYWDRAGMTASALTQWSYGRSRVASNSPRAMGSDNYFTAADAATFLARLWRGELWPADDPRTAALLEWMTWSPRSGYGGWLGSRLPDAARATVRHKGGWLPPGCCSNDAVYNTLNEIGIVTVPDGPTYAVAILARRGRDYWGRQVRLVERASCEIYRAVSGDDALDCARPGDPTPPAGCGDVTYQGYCDRDTLVWCEADALRNSDCAARGTVCAWQDDAIGFNCLAP
jgi:beta-lactamase class A